MPEKIQKTDAEWQEQLTPEEFRVARKKGTERAFTGRYYENKEPGMYYCVCCGTPLFSSETKYDSGSGWPSFWKPVSEDKIREIQDESYGMKRVEVVCDQCDAHLGHVFEDGPEPSGLRYCINSVSMRFEPR